MYLSTLKYLINEQPNPAPFIAYWVFVLCSVLTFLYIKKTIPLQPARLFYPPHLLDIEISRSNIIEIAYKIK